MKPTDVAEAIIVVYCTCPSAEVAREIADRLVGDRLAACVNTIPGLHSTYRWKGEVQHETECLLMIKTRESKLPALRESIKANHPYELPEVIAVPVKDGLDAYLDWVRSNS